MKIINWGHEHFYNDHLMGCVDDIKSPEVMTQVLDILKNNHGLKEDDVVAFITTSGMAYIVEKKTLNMEDVI